MSATWCGSVSCGAPAVALAHWPGRSLPLCQPCLDRAQRVAEHMGFALANTPLDELRAVHCEHDADIPCSSVGCPGPRGAGS